jgi:serine/threonine-protein kinase
MVGKLGFAPIEQLQTGRAYPSSDLYSLAVTVIVLLTGQEPQDLFDDTTVAWHWQTALGARAGVNPEFAQVLERMLANKAGDRYQSVSEVVQALQALPAAMNLPTPAVSSSAPAVASNVSQVRTMAVERPDALMPQPRKRQAVIPPLVTRTSIWDNPWAVGVIYLILALGVGAASWAVVRSLLQRQRPQFLPPVVVSSPPTPTPTPSPASVTYRKTLALAPGDQVTVQGALQPQEIQNYLIQGQQGQELTAYLAGQGILMTVLGPDQKPLNPQARQVAAWSGVLPATGNYYLQLKPIPEVSQHDYQLTVSLADLTPPTLVPIPSPPVTDSPTPTVDISPSPSIEEEQVNFPEGASSQQLSAQAIPNVVKRYLVNARAGQVLSAQVLNGAVTLSIRDPEGKLIENAGKVLTWESLLPESGNYQIDVAAINKTDFTLDIGVRDGQEQVP